MDLKIIELLNAAGYAVQFANLHKDGVLPAGPACLVSWEGIQLVTRGMSPTDALRGAAQHIVTEVEGKRIEELKRRGEMHAALSAELAR